MDNLTLSNIKLYKRVESTYIKVSITQQEYVNLLDIMTPTEKANLFIEVCESLGFEHEGPFYSYDDESVNGSWTVSDTLYLGKKP